MQIILFNFATVKIKQKMDTQEFDSLVLTNADVLKPFAITLTKDHEAARDLCQETLYKAFAYRKMYNAGTNIKAWLYTIMRNIFINEYRRNNRKRVIIDTLTTIQPQFVFSVEMNLRLKEIYAAINQLPEIFKTSCLLYLQGYKYHEIAQSLNQPLGTIKSRIHFAKKMLQKQLDR